MSATGRMPLDGDRVDELTGDRVVLTASAMEADRAGMLNGGIDPLVAGRDGLPGSERAAAALSPRGRGAGFGPSAGRRDRALGLSDRSSGRFGPGHCRAIRLQDPPPRRELGHRFDGTSPPQ